MHHGRYTNLISPLADENYLSFLETLKGAPKTESVSLEALSECLIVVR